uniref:putative tyrosinase-like protein tyr-3 n=1 Tax=Styela clava TaxID=7725 RepID=UPI00193AD92E|nr:putative tyrosinase-like protein tyr-3 [Styela clava]
MRFLYCHTLVAHGDGGYNANVTSVGGLYEEYSGFAWRAPYWKLTIGTLAIDDDCIPKFMFYARAAPSTTSPLTTVVPSTTSSATTTNPVPCTDMKESCSTWAADGECRKSPDIMLVLCKKSCKACTTKPPGKLTRHLSVLIELPFELNAGTTTTNPPKACVDEYSSCSNWAMLGQCERNPRYMKDTCRKSCRECWGSTY